MYLKMSGKPPNLNYVYTRCMLTRALEALCFQRAQRDVYRSTLDKKKLQFKSVTHLLFLCLFMKTNLK